MAEPTVVDQGETGHRPYQPFLPWRFRVLTVVMPAAVAVFAAIGLVPDTDVELASPTVRGASETACLSTGPLDSVDAVNTFAETVRGGPHFLGADVGADVVLQDGRRLWVFGDTLRAENHSGRRFVRNSMLVFDDSCAHVVVPDDRDALIPDRKDGVGYWPMSIARVGSIGYDLVSVLAQRVRRTGGGTFDFENLGPAVTIFIVPRGRTPQLIVARDVGVDDPDPSRPTWGAATAIHDGWIYLYGTARPKTAGVFGYSLRVARLRPDDLLDPHRWRYWDGHRWQPDPDRAAELIPAEGGVSQTLSVFPKNGRWYALSKRDEFLGSDLTVWTAPGPTGPFTASEPLANLPSESASGQLRYMPLAHPDLLPDDDSVLVSYSRNNTDVGKVMANPFLYRPSFLRVPLPR